MILDLVDRYFARTTFVLASLIFLLALLEGLIQVFGRSLLAGLFSPGRLLDIAATLLFFVIVQVLRQIRDELRSKA